MLLLRALRTLLLTAPLAAAGGAWAADKPTIQLYRYVDSRGVTVLDTQGVPPEYVAKGYQILNQQGRVLQTIAPAPTADEIRQREARQAQAEVDAQLLHLYPSLQDLERAHVREQGELDSRIAVANNSLQGLQLQQSSLQTQAAAQERAGQPVQASIVQQLTSIGQERAALNTQIAGYQRRKAEVEQVYGVNRVRMLQLFGNGQ